MNKYFPNLFSPIKIGNVTLKNRVVMSAMDTCYFSVNGTVTRKAIAHYMERAKGGVGLIFTEVSPFDWPGGRQSRREPRFNSPLVTTEWAEVIQCVHSFGTKICAQLSHAGFISDPDYCEGRPTVAPWAEGKAASSEAHSARTLTKEEIEYFMEEIAECLRNIKSCDFDGVEFHAAHDYLINEFLSPATNHRTDEYGGTTENRARFLTDAVRLAKEIMGPDKIISVRLACREEIEGGITAEEGAKIAKFCEEAGANLIDCSIGQGPDGAATEAEWMPDGRRIHYAAYIKPRLSKAKVGVVGKLRTPELCEKAIAEGSTDLVFLARQMLCDPYWAIKAETGRSGEIRKCLSCREGCFAAFRPKSGSIRCVINPYTGFEDTATEHNPGRAAFPKKVLIIGGGIAGMQAAIIAAKRGHEVILTEKSDHLGGQMVLAGIPPHKEAVTEAKDWFIAELARVGVEPRLNTEADIEYIRSVKPDVILLAIGSRPSRPPVEGIDLAADGWDVLRDAGHMPQSKEIVIIGGGTVGCEIAQTLIEKGNHITIIEMDDGLSKKQNLVHRQHNQQVLEEADTVICLNSAVQKVEKDKVTYRDGEGNIREAVCDMVICATGQKPKDPQLAGELRSMGYETYTLGDATESGDFRTATRSAMDVVMALS